MSSAAGTAPQVPAPAVFTVKPEVTLDGERLYLGQLAACSGSPVICEEAYSVDLGPSPQPGRTLAWPKRKLLELLTREWDEAAIELRAPEMIRITAAYSEVDTAFVEEKLRLFLAEEMQSREGLAVEVDRLSFASRPKLRPGSLEVHFPDWRGLGEQSEDWLLKRLSGTQRVEVFFSAENTAHGEEMVHTATVALRLKKLMPVPRRNIGRGDVIGRDDVEEQWVDFGRGNLRAVGSINAVIGRRARGPLNVGQPIAANLLESPPVVRKGQLARLIMTGSGLNVTSQVRLLGNGTHGQSIEAVYPATKKKLRVRVVDSSTVEYIR